MSYNTISTIIFLAAVVGIILMILRRLPEAVASQEHEKAKSLRATLAMSGRRTALVYYKVRSVVVFWSKRALNFALEAKGMRHPSLANYRIRKIFRGRSATATVTESPAEPTTAVAMDDVVRYDPARGFESAPPDEQFHLQQISEDPRNLNLYSALGQFYMANGKFADAQSVYEYLVKRDPSNSSYQAKLAYCKINLKLYDDAAQWYEKSLTLDPGHPNRYYNLALAYKMSGKRQQSARAIRRALELEPKNQKYRELLKSV